MAAVAVAPVVADLTGNDGRLADVSIDATDVSAVLSDGDGLQLDFDLWLAVIIRARKVFGRPPAGFDNTRLSVGRVVGLNRHVN